MFQNACKSLLQTLMPIVVAFKTKNGEVKGSIGAGMVVNDDGWFVTAGHILTDIADRDAQVFLDPQKRKEDEATDYVAIFGQTGARLQTIGVEKSLDLGIGKLENYVAPKGHVFPRLRVRDVEQGELLCRAGYPFLGGHIELNWSEEDGFTFTNLFPVPIFVNEALVSRFLRVSSSGRWIETSSPGLKGQSGGPLVDSDGLVCGIQVNTFPYPLNFKGAGQDQVLNVGRAVHVDAVSAFLDRHKVKYSKED